MPTSVASGRRGRGPNDPDRRARIAAEAIADVAERGVEVLTHSALAARAEVPLGSTTYYFATLDDLLAVALRTAADADVAALQEWAANLPVDADFAVALTDLVLRYLGPERDRTLVGYELYVAALHRPYLREISIAWDTALRDIFSARTDPTTGRLLAVAYCGMLIQAVLTEPAPSRDDIETIFQCALGR
jgi:DNA-binding transcriptional regulator YbjK